VNELSVDELSGARTSDSVIMFNLKMSEVCSLLRQSRIPSATKTKLIIHRYDLVYEL
jgi:hypothetical protein